MKVYEEDLILSREFQAAMGKGSPRPSWDDIEARARTLSPGWRRGRLKLLPALAVLLLVIAIPALAFAANEVFFDSSPPPFQSAIDSFARVGGPPGMPADTAAVIADPRRVVTLPLSNDMTAALWAAPTIDGNYCWDTQMVSGDPDSPGLGLAWGQGYSSFPGCGKHDGALDVGYDVAGSTDGPPVVLISGGSGLKDADSVEVKYDDGSSSSAPTVYVGAPVDAVLFMFQIPLSYTESGIMPVELILRADDNSVLTRDDTVFSNLSYGAPGSEIPKSETPGSEAPECEYDPTVPGSIPAPECGAVLSGDGWSMSYRPNSPGYQERHTEYPGNAHP